MPNLIPVSLARHGSKTLLPRTSWAFAAGQQAAALLVAEFPVAAHHLPIVFIKPQEQYVPAALFSLTAGTNRPVDTDGNWVAEYIPAILRRHPFALLRKEENSDEFVLCIDEASDRLADRGGEPLFIDGKQTPTLEKAFSFAQDYLRNTAAGERLGALLHEHDLLVPLVLTHRSSGKVIRRDDIHMVDEKKFNALADEAFLLIRGSGLLPAIYAHFFSLRHLERLPAEP